MKLPREKVQLRFREKDRSRAEIDGEDDDEEDVTFSGSCVAQEEDDSTGLRPPGNLDATKLLMKYIHSPHQLIQEGLDELDVDASSFHPSSLVPRISYLF